MLLELVYTEYEVHRSIIRHGAPIQLIPPQNQVFGTLTMGVGKSTLENESPTVPGRG